MINRGINPVRVVGIFIVAAMLATVSIRPAQAHLCACCVDPGEWYEESREVYDYEFEIFNQLTLYRFARIYVTDATPEEIKGIRGSGEDSRVEDYGVSLSRKGRQWTFSLKKRGKSGSLIFTLPKTAVRFGADLTVNVRKEIKDPISIYKEVRFKGGVWGTGIFKEGNAPGTKCLLVLQGYGNNCMSSTDFKTWTLAVSGPAASYRFYGAFVF